MASVPAMAVASVAAPAPASASATPALATDGGKSRLAHLMEETRLALYARASEKEIEATLDAFEEAVVADTSLSDAVIQAAIDDRNETNRRAASHGPVPYPSPATAAFLFGVPGRLSRALVRRRSG